MLYSNLNPSNMIDPTKKTEMQRPLHMPQSFWNILAEIQTFIFSCIWRHIHPFKKLSSTLRPRKACFLLVFLEYIWDTHLTSILLSFSRAIVALKWSFLLYCWFFRNWSLRKADGILKSLLLEIGWQMHIGVVCVVVKGKDCISSIMELMIHIKCEMYVNYKYLANVLVHYNDCSLQQYPSSR